MYYTFIVSHVTTDVVEAQSTRLEICNEILEEVNKLKASNQHKDFFKALKKAKAELVTHMREGAGVCSDGSDLADLADDVRPFFNNAGTFRMASIGQAEGVPGSSVRLTQHK